MTLRRTILIAVPVLGLLGLAVAVRAEEHGNKVTWKRIVGIVVPGSLVGRRLDGTCDVDVGCVEGTPAPWVTTEGFAEVILDTGKVDFMVKGLVLAGDPSFSNIGTTSVISMVKGTLVCNDTEPGAPELVNTDAVPLSSRGNAKFHGHVDLPASCVDQSGDIVFLIRIADVSDPEREALIDSWNAFGAVRSDHDSE